jgi:Lipocalin-like domain
MREGNAVSAAHFHFLRLRRPRPEGAGQVKSYFQEEIFMKHSIAAILVAAALWAGIAPAVCAENPLVGTWQLTSFSLVVLDTKETSRPYGDHPTGYIQYSPGGHMVMFLTAGELRPPASGSYTDVERADVHRAIVGAYAGTYTVEGNKVTYHVLTSWRPEWIGRDQVRYFEINGTNLTIKTSPLTFSRTGQTIVGTLTFDRVE